jgi:hypothetical protein
MANEINENNIYPKFRIVLCEIYNNFIHGLAANITSESHYIVIDKFAYNTNIYNLDYDSEYDLDINSDTNSDTDSELSDCSNDDITMILELHNLKYNELRNSLNYDYISKIVFVTINFNPPSINIKFFII